MFLKLRWICLSRPKKGCFLLCALGEHPQRPWNTFHTLWDHFAFDKTKTRGLWRLVITWALRFTLFRGILWRFSYIIPKRGPCQFGNSYPFSGGCIGDLRYKESIWSGPSPCYETQQEDILHCIQTFSLRDHKRNRLKIRSSKSFCISHDG